MKGLLKNGVIKEIKHMADTEIPTEYKVDCNGKDFIAVADYVLKSNSKNIKLKINNIRIRRRVSFKNLIMVLYITDECMSGGTYTEQF